MKISNTRRTLLESLARLHVTTYFCFTIKNLVYAQDKKAFDKKWDDPARKESAIKFAKNMYGTSIPWEWTKNEKAMKMHDEIVMAHAAYYWDLLINECGFRDKVMCQIF